MVVVEHSEQISVDPAGVAAALDLGPGEAAAAVRHYFQHVPPEDLHGRTPADLAGLVSTHAELARVRPPGRPVVALRTPTRDADGWTAGGATVVHVVTDDTPFLVDSVTLELQRQGWAIRALFHPRFAVRRDVSGRLQGVGPLRPDRLPSTGPAVTGLAESWMHLEVRPPAGQDPGRAAVALHDGLVEVLRLVAEAVADWPRMHQRIAETRALLSTGPYADPPGEPASPTALREPETAAFLGWLAEDHLTFLGYREYRLTEGRLVAEGGPASPAMVAVPGTGLGILRGDPPAGDEQPLGAATEVLVVGKDSARSRVHRADYLDRVTVRLLDDAGRPVGERRFLGLFTSTAATASVRQVPVLRDTVAQVLSLTGRDPESHDGKALLDVLEAYPRDELFQTPVEELAEVAVRITRLKDRRTVKLFCRADPAGRFWSCLVLLPPDRYSGRVRRRVEDVLRAGLGPAVTDVSTSVRQGNPTWVHVVLHLRPGASPKPPDLTGWQREIDRATRSWTDVLAQAVVDDPAADRLLALADWLPESYRADHRPEQAVPDLRALAALLEPGAAPVSTRLTVVDRPDDEAHLRLTVLRRDPLTLAAVLPHLTRLDVEVLDERPYELALPSPTQPGGGTRAHLYEFGLRVPEGHRSVARRWDDGLRDRFVAAFVASCAGESELDEFQSLVLAADLDWTRVALLRAIGRYLRQTGVAFSPDYLAAALRGNLDVTRRLVQLFEVRFDPGLRVDRGGQVTIEPVERHRRAAQLVDQIGVALDEVPSLDHDTILRRYLAVLTAMTRTNFWVPGREALAIKLHPRELAHLPEPRPAYEVFVSAPRVEGVHLRFGPVARGGLRWSDRPEDFRTEVLGLAKAQLVKNAVIVPVGAKGGFHPRRLPDPAAGRDAWLAEGRACYRIFVTSLLQVTDNLVDERVVPPDHQVRHDGDDPYLVVAADKGTATFSDLANEVSVAAGFWLGDAFASGGSAGYDHKAMGITARGAWESARRHLRELGRDPDTDEVTVVGIGDMSGDVFGNGMLLSRHLKLVAAFDHRHVVLDPDPDPAASWAERRRLFDLPRSSWADYDRAVLSPGGGIWPRTAKAVPVSEPVRRVLGLAPEVTSLSPAALISACLRAPVDLLYNGGIGTYLKAATETHAEAGDRANDAVRVNGAEVRARCVVEGGNLGCTALGRVEYARAGGRINTDFLDNSAGVDASDHEVNLKILFAPEVAAGRLTVADRNALLAEMTEEVAELVLTHNADQNRALANSVAGAVDMARVHEDWLQRLTEAGRLDRDLEGLPDTRALEARRAAGEGLTAPELATVLAHTKLVLAEEVLASDLPDDPALAERLRRYFPTAVRGRFPAAIGRHRLRREILTTELVNDFVNRAGSTAYARLSGETGAGPADLVRAHLAARRILGTAALDDALDGLGGAVDAATQTRLRLEVRTLVERATRWLVNNRPRPVDVEAAVDELAAGVQAVVTALPDLLTGRDAAAYQARRQASRDAGVPEPLAGQVAVLPPAYGALTVVQTAARTGEDLLAVAAVHLSLGAELGLDRLLAGIVALPRPDRWQAMARAALRDDLHAVHAQLTAAALALSGVAEGSAAAGGTAAGGAAAAERVAAWHRATPGVGEAAATIEAVCSGTPDLARMTVGLRVVRSLLPSGAPV